MAEAYQRPVARIRRGDGTVVGAGFLAPRGFVVTCAHVVNDALAREKLSTARPDKTVSFDLPWAGGGAFAGRVIDWRPPIVPAARQGEACVDIAVLQLDRLPPEGCAVAPQAPVRIAEGTAFRVMGFPDGADAGAPAKASVRGTDAGGWHHVEADREYGRTITPGFSGAPAISEGRDRRLLGMIDTSDPEERRGVLIPVSALMRACPPLAEPFRGLEAFREDDEAYFFGRDTFKARLWDSFQRHTITLLTGPSGVGKSSLINTGFLPKLRTEEDWQVVRFRPGSRPVGHLARELVSVLQPGLDTLRSAREAKEQEEALLADPTWLARIGETCRLCIIIDQFEETFTLALPTAPMQHRGFLAILEHLAGLSDLPSVRVVLGLRSDFQTLLQADEAAATLVDRVSGAATIMLRAMTPAERERVILGPLDAQHLDVSLEYGLLGRIMEEVARNPDALPLLEFALAELWGRVEIAPDGRRLTIEAYETIGGVSGALAVRADALVRELKLDMGQVRRLLLELVRVAEASEQDARRPRRKAELDALDPALWAVAQTLAPTRLLVMSDEPAVDIVHEALFRQWTTLQDWIGAEREFLRFRQRLQERRREWEAEGGELLSERMLEDAERWLGERIGAFTPEELAYVEASRQTLRAHVIQGEVDRFWNRIELFKDAFSGDLKSHEVDALVALQQASPEVRQAFLLSAVSDEARARRLCRERPGAVRAAVALDGGLLKKVGAAVLDRLSKPILPGNTRRTEALLTLATDVLVWNQFDFPTVASLIERLAAATAETTDRDQTKAYAQAIEALAGSVDAVLGQRMLEHFAGAMAGTTDPYQTAAYAEAIASLAGSADAAFGQRMMDRLAGAMAETTDPYQTAAHAQAIGALAGSADAVFGQRMMERLAAAMAETTDRYQTIAYAQAIASLAGSADRAFGKRLMERLAAAMAETNDPYQKAAYAEAIASLAGSADAAFGQRMMERLAAAMAVTHFPNQMEAYAQAIASLAGSADAAFGQRMIDRLAGAMAETTHPYQTAGYAQVIASLAGSADTAFRQRTIDRLAGAMAETTDPDQTAAYAQVVASLAGSADTAFGQRMIDRLAGAMAETTDPDQTAAYAQAIGALAGAVGVIRSTTFAKSAGEWVAGIEGVGDRRRIGGIGSALAASRRVMDREAWLFIATEFLKHPLSVDADDLVAALADECGLATGSWHSVWDVVRWLDEHETWLPLREPFGSGDSIRRRIAHLAEHGAPLPA